MKVEIKDKKEPKEYSNCPIIKLKTTEQDIPEVIISGHEYLYVKTSKCTILIDMVFDDKIELFKTKNKINFVNKRLVRPSSSH